MPLKYEWVDVETVSTTAESLKKAAEKLTQVAYEMEQADLKKAAFPWTQRQWDCHYVIMTLANQCVAVIESQILAKKQNRPSPYELIQEKSRRDIAARNARNASKPSTGAPKKRGRPKKA